MKRPSHATVVAYVALFVAIGTGGAFAVSLGRDSVDSREIAKGAVRAAEIKKGAVRSGEIKNRAIGVKELDDFPHGMMTNFRGLPNLAIGRGEQDATYEDAGMAEPRSAFDLGAGTFTAPVAGTYEISYSIEWGSEGRFTLAVIKNGSATALSNSAVYGPGGGGQRVEGLIALKQGDRVKAHVSYEATNFNDPLIRTSNAIFSAAFKSS